MVPSTDHLEMPSTAEPPAVLVDLDEELLEAPASEESRSDAVDPFEVRILLAQEQSDQPGSALLHVDIRGGVYSEHENVDTDLAVGLFDITDGHQKPAPILSSDGQHGGQGPGLWQRMHNGVLPQGWSSLPDWTTVVTIRLDSIRFARRGHRCLGVTAAILAANDKPLAQGKAHINIHCRGLGYIDQLMNRPRVGRLMLCWMKGLMRGKLSAGQKDFFAENLQRYQLEDALKQAETIGKKILIGAGWLSAEVQGRVSQNTIQFAKKLKAMTRSAERAGLLELGMQALALEGVADADQVRALHETAAIMDIAPERFREMLERSLPVTLHAEPDLNTIIGLDSQLDSAQRRKILSQAYSRWNSRVTHADPDVRRQAELMVELISTASVQA